MTETRFPRHPEGRTVVAMRTPRPIAARTGSLRSSGAHGDRGGRGPMATPVDGDHAVVGGVADVATR